MISLIHTLLELSLKDSYQDDTGELTLDTTAVFLSLKHSYSLQVVNNNLFITSTTHYHPRDG